MIENNYILNDLKMKVKVLEEEQKEIKKRLNELEKDSIVTKEKLNNIQEMLFDIKTDLKHIADKIETVQIKENEKQVDKFEKIKFYIITSIIGILVGYIMNIILKK